jgi:hypothetical protein
VVEGEVKVQISLLRVLGKDARHHKVGLGDRDQVTCLGIRHARLKSEKVQ